MDVDKIRCNDKLIYSSTIVDQAEAVVQEESDNSSDEIVQEALKRLPEAERTVLIRYYFDCQTVNDLSDDLNVSPVQANNLRLRAQELFSVEIERICRERKLSVVYFKCPICNHGKRTDINLFINQWMRDHQWNFWGVMAALNSEFGLKIMNQAVIHNHMEYHMNFPVSDKIVGALSSLMEEKSKGSTSTYVVIPKDIKDKIEELSALYTRPNGDIIRHALMIGIPMLERILEMNEIMSDQIMTLAKTIRKIKLD